MDHLLSGERRADLAREVESGRLEREPRTGGDEAVAGTRPPPKIRRLRDAGPLARA
jgi:hypothetical protein